MVMVYWSDRDRKSGGVACYVRTDLCFNSRNIFSNSIEHAFFIYLSIGIFYRPPNVNSFLEKFFNDLKRIYLHKNEVYFVGDFNVNLLLNYKFILKEK